MFKVFSFSADLFSSLEYLIINRFNTYGLSWIRISWYIVIHWSWKSCSGCLIVLDRLECRRNRITRVHKCRSTIAWSISWHRFRMIMWICCCKSSGNLISLKSLLIPYMFDVIIWKIKVSKACFLFFSIRNSFNSIKIYAIYFEFIQAISNQLVF